MEAWSGPLVLRRASMVNTSWHRRVSTCAVFAIALASCGEPPPARPIPEPTVGQKGKDVVWVPTPDALVERMLDLAALSSTDVLIDLGSGDGRLVIAAARRGARAKGIEFNPDLVMHAAEQARRAGVAARVTFEQGDIFTSALDQATVVTLFLSTEINMKLRPRLLDLAPGTRIVSNTFEMAGWEPDEVAKAGDCASWCDALLWIVPAKVEGDWLLDGQPLRLSQSFQHALGTVGGVPVRAVLRGSAITLTVDGRRYAGQVEGAIMTGERDDGVRWRAERVPR